MLYSILFFSVIIYVIQNITGTYGDCNYYVTTQSDLSNGITYQGCKDTILTSGLMNVSSPTTDIYSFKGIPFAEPPVNELRFNKPIPKRNFENITYNATYYRNACMQPLPLDIPNLPSEDCLYMNVWTPTLNSSAKLPVMFWIYGGIFLIGSGSQLLNIGLYFRAYDGSLLAAHNVVLVTFNHRLGVFGFFNGNREDAPGNIGLWDQAMALNWTRQNIQKFGGDPDNILIFGESSGSMSVSSLIVSPITRNWFKNAICESGTSYVTPFSRPKDYMYNISRKYASNAIGLDCDDPITMVDCLRNISASVLLAAQTAPILPGSFLLSSTGWNSDQPYPLSDVAPFQPIYGDQFLPMCPNQAVKVGNHKTDINILIGHNENEGVLLNFAATLLRGVLTRYNPAVESDTSATPPVVEMDIRNLIIDNDTIGIQISEDYTTGFSPSLSILGIPILYPNLLRNSANNAFGDYFLTCPAVLYGSHISKNQSLNVVVYQYRFTYITSQSISKLSTWTNATHTDEYPLVFGVPVSELQSTLWNDNDRKMSIQMMYIWTYFAKNGAPPNVNGNIWPPYSLKSDGSTNATYLELNPDNQLLGKVYVNRYRGNDGYFPNCIQNCFNYWEDIINGQF